MAELFLAKQTGMEGFEKLVVVKRILPQLCSDDSFVKMFLNEARVAARLNHPNVAQIFDLGKLGDQYFIAMEFVHGEDLRSVIREASEQDERPSLGLSCRIVADTLAGLHYAHTRVGTDGKPLGLVHRDVSPQNVLVTYEGSVKLVDFGIAKATREVNAAQTQAGLLKGKYAYMSPEQARGQPVDARADVFCAGVLLWELVTWQRLFKRNTEMATLMAVAEEPLRAPRTVEASLPVALDELIMKALARAPEDRFASAQEMRAALETLIRTSGWEADSLALSSWMREVFANKLRAQAADIAAAGMASLEDYLLTIEEKTSISWMAPLEAEKKTPSSGLPPSRPVSGQQAAAAYDDGPTTKVDDLYAGAAKVTEVDKRPMQSDATASTVRDLAVPKLPPSVPLPNPNQPPPWRSNELAATLKGNEPAPLAGVIVPSLAPLTATPTAATAGVVAPRAPDGASATTPSMAAIADPQFGAEKSTAKRPAVDDPPSPVKRFIVAGSAGALFIAIALTVALWPSKEPAAGGTAQPLATAQPPAVASGAAVAAGPSVATGATGATTTPAPSGESAKAAMAVLQISIDAPASITVDGQKQPPGTSATVDVLAGVDHVVTVQRAGHGLRKLHVPALAPGERMPLTFSVR
ncbi:MAG: serine/threonine protein kinase [Myxococcales bacterium]|nr:serine/threonine protein kinase [Myxococcales bacterium]